MMDSIWQDRSLPVFPPLEGTVRTDVLIIGGGMAGLLCALELKRAGVDCILVEADRVARGTTGRTTAKITVQHGLFCADMVQRRGELLTRQYLEANQAALHRWRQLAAEIPCGFETRDSYVYSIGDGKKLERELKAMDRVGFPGEYRRQTELPFLTAGAVKVSDQAQFHPLLFLKGVLPELRIYEQTAVQRIEGTTAFTQRGRIHAEKIIVATHFPMLNRYGAYFLKLYQSRSYVLALENAPAVNGMYVDESETGLSFRSAGNCLLLGGGSHRTGKDGGGWAELKAFCRIHYPESRIVKQWAAQDCMSLDGIPYIGRYSPRTPRLYVAAGFNKWGMTGAMAAAMILKDLVQDRKNPWEDVFSPQRTVFHKQLWINAGEAAGNLLRFSAPRCPHLGCALRWNPREHTWDCPCHGSRFTKEGKVLENPAAKNIEKGLPE